MGIRPVKIFPVSRVPVTGCLQTQPVDNTFSELAFIRIAGHLFDNVSQKQIIGIAVPELCAGLDGLSECYAAKTDNPKTNTVFQMRQNL